MGLRKDGKPTQSINLLKEQGLISHIMQSAFILKEHLQVSVVKSIEFNVVARLLSGTQNHYRGSG